MLEDTFSPRVRTVAGALAATCLVAGPLAALLARVFVPGSSSASIAGQVADYAAHPGRTHALLVVGAFVWLMVPAALVAASPAWRRAPALSLVAGALSLAGWVSVVCLAAQDALIAQAGHPAFEHAQAVALTTAWSDSGLVNAYVNLFVVGHFFGTALLGVALWRARAIPRWAAALIVVAMPLHLTAFVASITPLDVAAYAMLLAGFCACAAQVVLATVRAPVARVALA
jgi:hypothetical protein